jgi:hypothetical protein
MDYFADYAAECKDQLIAAKFSFSESNDSKIAEAFLNSFIRQIPLAPRKIIIADGFQCPVQVRRELNAFCQKAMKGQSLKPYLSSRINDANYNDILFNDWRIHHFHLGKEAQTGFIERADFLLFAIVLNDAILCIDIIPHSDRDAWYKKEMVDIAYKNWPQIFESTNLKGILPSTTPMTNAEIKKYRRINVGYSLTMADGTVNMGLGMGSMSNGFSLRAQMELMRIRRTCTHLQEYTKNNYDFFIAEANKVGCSLQQPFEFHIQVNKSKWGMYELQSRMFFNFEQGLGLAYHSLI